MEITEIPPLKPGEVSLLEMHSVLNVFNVLRGELCLIGLTLGDSPEVLAGGIARCDAMIQGLMAPATAWTEASRMEAHIDGIEGDVRTCLARSPGMADHPEILESLANLASVFAILRVRTRELLARAHAPDRWERIPVAALKREFFNVFAAIEKNSRGRYRIRYNPALQEEQDYYFDFKVEGSDQHEVETPLIFLDVLRDLIANARKYTQPGGHVTAALFSGPDELRLVVKDTGRGIPADELEQVVHFGHRASNVADVRTMGGGFGLTKAFFVTKQFGGRFWLGSRLGVGTSVRIHVPRVPTKPVIAGG